jgi:hypothetical protein
LSEVKWVEDVTQGGADAGKAIKQLQAGMKRLDELNYIGDLERVEIVIPKGAKLNDNDLKILNGYLVKISNGNKPVSAGYGKFVQVIEL